MFFFQWEIHVFLLAGLIFSNSKYIPERHAILFRAGPGDDDFLPRWNMRKHQVTISHHWHILTNSRILMSLQWPQLVIWSHRPFLNWLRSCRSCRRPMITMAIAPAITAAVGGTSTSTAFNRPPKLLPKLLECWNNQESYQEAIATAQCRNPSHDSWDKVVTPSYVCILTLS